MCPLLWKTNLTMRNEGRISSLLEEKIRKRYTGIAGIAYSHYSEPEEGAEGQRKDNGSNPECVEVTFGCQLAKVSVTLLSAVLFQSIGKRPAEHSWVRSIPGPQQTAMLLQLGSRGGTAASVQVPYGPQLLWGHPLAP